MVLRLSPMAAAPLSLPRLTRFLSSISHLSPSLLLLPSSSSTDRLTTKPYISKPSPRRTLTTIASSAPKAWSDDVAGGERYNVIVVEGGCEATLASARLGARTLLLTLNLDRIARQLGAMTSPKARDTT